MSDALIDVLIGRGAASRGQVEEAKRKIAVAGGRLSERLIEAGCSPDRILATWTAATGIPAAPRSALARPAVPVGLGVAPETWRELAAVPFGTDDEGNVLIAISEPSARAPLEALDLPDFVVRLAPPADVDTALRRAFPALAGHGAGAFDIPSTAVDPVSASDEDVLRRIAAEAGAELGARTLSDTLDAPPFGGEGALAGSLDGGLDDEGDDFDDPTVAMDSAQLALEPADAAPPKRAAEPPRVSQSAFDDDEPSTVAMSAADIRAALHKRATPATTTAGAPAPSVPAVTYDDDDDEFEPKTVATTLDEIRATADAAAARPVEDDQATRVRFDFSAAADGFDDGEGRDLVERRARAGGAGVRELPVDRSVGDAPLYEEGGYEEGVYEDDATVARPVSYLPPADDDEEPTRAAAPFPSSFGAGPFGADDAGGDDFDEATLAADAAELMAPVAAPSSRAPVRASRAPPGDDDAERALSDARTRMQAALDDVGGATAAPFAEGDVFGSSRDEAPAVAEVDDADFAGVDEIEDDDDEATVAGVDPAGATRVSSQARISGSGGELSDADTAFVPMLPKPAPAKERPVSAEPTRGPSDAESTRSGVDTGPTGPIAVRGYQVKDVLGAGGMATVYRALQRSADREVALKILSPHLAGDAAFVARFQREIRSSASLTHPNIIRVYDYGDEAGVYYMATEVMDGGSLRDALHDFGALPAPLTVKMLEHLLRGIGHAHKRGMVHRDIKPANLMLSSDGLLKLGDFGIAKSETDENLTRAGALFGTPAYMSPEQALGRPVEPPSDLFACGIIGYELLTGENPFQADTASAALLKVSRADVPPLLLSCPAAPPLLVDVVQRLLQRETSERYAAAEDALADLRPLVEAVDRRWPDLVRRYVADANAVVAAASREHAAAELERARHHLAQNPPLALAAVAATYFATVLDPDNGDARRLLDELREGGSYELGPSRDPRVHDAERALEDDPRAPGLLRRLSDLYRAGGDPVRAAVWLRQYLLVKPTDAQARAQLEQLVGPSPLGGLDEWEVPPQLPRAALEIPAPDSHDDGPMPEDTQVPSAGFVPRGPKEATSEEIDLRPLGFAPPDPGPASVVPPAAGVRPGMSVHDPSEMLRAATARARGGLQVLKSDGPPTPAPTPVPGRAGLGPALQQPQQTFALPRAQGKPPTSAGLPRAAKLALAVVGALALLVVVVIATLLALSGDDVDVLVAQADPGSDVAPVERQRALLAFARERLAAGDGIRALEASRLAHALDAESAEGSEALLLRGRASAAVGDPLSAAADFKEVLARFPEGNLLRLEAEQQLQALPKQ